MKLRFAWAFIVVAGCHTMMPPLPTEMPGSAKASEPDVPIDEAPDGLALAAQCMEKGAPAQAVVHLQKHVSAHPDALMIRAYLGELLVKLDRPTEAQSEFERFIRDAEQQDGPARRHLVHGHTRLMEIAQLAQDEYTERLHRGIGLVLLAQQQAQDEKHHDPGLTEQVVCRAVSELRECVKLQANEAQPWWYQYEAWSLLGQRQPAEIALAHARRLAPFSVLTPHERLGLAMTTPCHRD